MMAASKIIEKAPGWFTRVLLPEIMEMKGDLKAMNARIEGLDVKIDSLRNELKSDISRVESRVEDLDKRLDIVQRLAVLEAKQREFEKKSSN